MITVALLVLVVALVLLVLAALNVGANRWVSLGWAGLALWEFATEVLPRVSG